MSSEPAAHFIKRLGYLIPVVVVLLAIALLFPAIEHARQRARHEQEKYNLKQMGLAIQNYQGLFHVLP